MPYSLTMHVKAYDSIIEVGISLALHADIGAEIKALIEACRGDKRDRFGHIKYWKSMLALIPVVVGREVKSRDISEISRQIGFNPDQVRRSLDRFVDRGVLIKEGTPHSYTWKLNSKRFPLISFLSKKELPTRIVRYFPT